VGEWINWYSQTIEYYSALKGNEMSSPEKTLRNFKIIVLSERSQSEKATYTVCDSNYVTFWNRQNCGDINNISS